MTRFTWDKKNERKEYAETMNEENQQEGRIDPLSKVGTRHSYTVPQKAMTVGSAGFLTWTPGPTMQVFYNPLDRSALFTIGEDSASLDKQQFEDLRRVLRAFAHDPKFNEGTEELV